MRFESREGISSWLFTRKHFDKSAKLFCNEKHAKNGFPSSKGTFNWRRFSGGRNEGSRREKDESVKSVTD